MIMAAAANLRVLDTCGKGLMRKDDGTGKMQNPDPTQPPPPAVVPIPDVLYDSELKKHYSKGRFLGKGGFAKCYEVTDPISGEVFACKIVPKVLLQKNHQREKMAQEITIHRNLKHKHVVGFHSYFEDAHHVYIVLELCEKKSMMEMHRRRKTITESEARYFLRQICLAVAYLHDNNTIHRDLKLGNIFITEKAVLTLKLGDFGLATTLTEKGERRRTMCGTPNYIAPEILCKKGHSLEVDVWSLGCILYTLLVGKPPFETNTLKDTYFKIKRADYVIPTSKASASARQLIQNMLMVDPAARPKITEVLSCDFMMNFYIPPSLPISCLSMPPRTEPEPGMKSQSNVLGIQTRSNFSPVPGPSSSKTTYGGKQECKVPNLNSKNKAMEYMRILQSQLFKLVTLTPEAKSGSDDECEDPTAAPLLWIAKWVDYSDKYGFGYQLSDDSIAVSFNDCTKLLLLADHIHMIYVDRNDVEHQCTKAKHSHELNKKVKLLNYFQQYMTENLVKTGGQNIAPEVAKATRLPILGQWFRSSQSVIMVLTNGTIQINNFLSHYKMIICPVMGAISIVDQNKPMRTYKFSDMEKYGCTATMRSSFQYALEKIKVILGKGDGPRCTEKKEFFSPVKM